MTFAGRVGLITGAGSGIGRATARILAERGGAVVAADANDPGSGSQCPDDQAGEGRFAGSAGADNADDFSGHNGKAQALDDRLGCGVRAIEEFFDFEGRRWRGQGHGRHFWGETGDFPLDPDPCFGPRC